MDITKRRKYNAKWMRVYRAKLRALRPPKPPKKCPVCTMILKVTYLTFHKGCPWHGRYTFFIHAKLQKEQEKVVI